MSSAPAVLGQTMNGFELENSQIPIQRIMRGGPPKDGIPAIDNPRYKPARQIRYLEDSELVLGLVHNDVAKAYPTRILVWHEIVNTMFGEEPVVITYCPLCGTGLAFTSRHDERKLSFGVSGLLYESDMLMYDRETNSLWSQIPGKAVTGPLAGASLQRLSVTHVTWSQWLQDYPDSLVLSDNTGFTRDYNRTPYAGYEHTERLFFPVSKQDSRYTNKTLVLGLEQDGKAKAWPFPELAKSTGMITDSFAGEVVQIKYDHETQVAVALDEQGGALPAIRAFWFAWYSFYPFTDIYKATE